MPRLSQPTTDSKFHQLHMQLFQAYRQGECSSGIYEIIERLIDIVEVMESTHVNKKETKCTKTSGVSTK